MNKSNNFNKTALLIQKLAVISSEDVEFTIKSYGITGHYEFILNYTGDNVLYPFESKVYDKIEDVIIKLEELIKKENKTN